MANNTIYLRNAQYRIRNIKNWHYLFCSRKAFKINESALFILKCIEQEDQYDSIVNKLESEYKLSNQSAKNDVDVFIKFLLDEKIIFEVN